MNYSQGVLSGALNEITKDLGEMIRINTEISQQKQSLLDAQEEELRSTKEEIMKLKKELELKNKQKIATSHTTPCLFKSHKEESSQNQIILSSSFNASHSLRSFDKITKKPKKTYLNPNRFDLLSQTKEETKEETENFLERKRELEKRGII